MRITNVNKDHLEWASKWVQLNESRGLPKELQEDIVRDYRETFPGCTRSHNGILMLYYKNRLPNLEPILEQSAKDAFMQTWIELNGCAPLNAMRRFKLLNDFRQSFPNNTFSENTIKTIYYDYLNATRFGEDDIFKPFFEHWLSISHFSSGGRIMPQLIAAYAKEFPNHPQSDKTLIKKYNRYRRVLMRNLPPLSQPQKIEVTPIAPPLQESTITPTEPLPPQVFIEFDPAKSTKLDDVAIDLMDMAKDVVEQTKKVKVENETLKQKNDALEKENKELKAFKRIVQGFAREAA